LEAVLSVFLREIFAKFRPEKYDFHLFKGFFNEKMTQIRQISKKNKWVWLTQHTSMIEKHTS
jgi:argonaute-like protein implicated in RNA metabolism and viral defense